MSFKESIIIPYELFKKCNFQTPSPPQHQEILKDMSLPSDLKMKLYSQSKALQQEKSPEIKETKPKHKPPDDTDFIVQLMPSKSQPFANSILQKIKGRPDDIKWNDNLEVTIGETFYAESNIVELLRFATKNTVVTSHTDIPIGGGEFLDKLFEIGVPRAWIKVSFRRKPPKRAAKRSQLDDSSPSDEDYDTPVSEGMGYSWVTY